MYNTKFCANCINVLNSIIWLYSISHLIAYEILSITLADKPNIIPDVTQVNIQLQVLLDQGGID
jgi:hypothetical protein